MTSPDAERKSLGIHAENAAVELLARKGMRILERNWRGGHQEIDIVAEDGDALVFVEVRARKAGGMVSPLESITPAKRRSMRKGAGLYLAAHGAWERPCRFDVVAAYSVGRELSLEHFTDVL